MREPARSRGHLGSSLGCCIHTWRPEVDPSGELKQALSCTMIYVVSPISPRACSFRDSRANELRITSRLQARTPLSALNFHNDSRIPTTYAAFSLCLLHHITKAALTQLILLRIREAATCHTCVTTRQFHFGSLSPETLFWNDSSS